jgi:hypothetical protein
MKLLNIYIVLGIHLLSLNILNAQKNNILDAVEIVNKSIDAMGGKENLESIKTLYTDSRTEMEGRQVNWIVKEMLPNKGTFQVVYNNRTVYQNMYDGKNGYEISNGEKKKADDEEFKDKKYKKNIFNELDYIDSNLWKLELIGEEKVDSKLCYKIKATLVNGLVKMLYYDKKTYFLVKTEKIINAEKNTFSTVLYSNYKKFNEITYFTEMKFGNNGQYQTATIVKLLVNEMVTDKDFN